MLPDGKLDAAVVLLAFALAAGVMAALVFKEIPEKNLSLFSALALGIWSVVTTYVGYRWGSSRGSAMKDQALADMAKGTGQ